MEPTVPDVFVLLDGHVIRLTQVEAFLVDVEGTRIQFNSGRYQTVRGKTPEDLMNEIAEQIARHLNFKGEEK